MKLIEQLRFPQTRVFEYPDRLSGVTGMLVKAYHDSFLASRH